MSKLTERHARQRELATTDPAAGVANEQVTIGIQPRDPGVVAAEAHHATTRLAWLDALRASRSGTNADLARLALTQKAYEEATAALERTNAEDALRQQRLEAVRRRRAETNARAEAIANQAAAWTRVREEKPRRRGVLDRILRRP